MNVSARPSDMNHPAGKQPAGTAVGRCNTPRVAWLALLPVILSSWITTPLAASEFPTAQALKTTVARERSFDGIVEAEQRSTVSSQVSARIEELPFDVDDYVQRGDIIVRFRNQAAAAELKQAEAASKEASARLQEARANHARIQTLYEQNRVSKADMDKATADLKSTQARVDAAAGALSAAQERYENTIVRAPYSGIVVERHVELGEMATVGTPLMTGISLEHLRVVVDVPQSDIAALRGDAEAEVDLPTGESLETHEVRIFPYADPSTHTFRVRLRLSEGQHGVYPGMWVKVKFRTGEQESLLVPESAVVQRSELTAVYVLDDQGTPRLRQVRLGRKLENGNRVILAGLGAGETVVTDPDKARIALLGRQP